MSTAKRISTGVLISVFALGGLAGCASGDETAREEEEVAEQSVGEEWEEAGEATAEATEDTAEEAAEETKGAAQRAGEATERGVQRTEDAAKDVKEGGQLAAERAEKQVEEWIGGGPVESDARRKIEEIEREMQNYRQGIEQQGHKLDDVTRLKMQQIEERTQLVKKQYNDLVRQTDFGVAQIDEALEGLAEDVKDDWETLEDDLEVELGRSYEEMDD